MHLRDFDATRDWGQLNEVVGAALRTGADLHVNHLNSLFGTDSAEALAFIESALLDDWESWPDERIARCEWPPTGERLTRESFARYRDQHGVVVIHARDEAAQELAVRHCVAHPLTMIASDGTWDGGQTHPRSAGTNSRVLGRYVRDQGALSLMEAIRKMSLAPARHLERRVPAMRNKGRLRVGADADIVVFDPQRVTDQATYHAPTRPPLGILAVLVRGVPVVRRGTIQTGVFPGRPIRGARSE